MQVQNRRLNKTMQSATSLCRPNGVTSAVAWRLVSLDQSQFFKSSEDAEQMLPVLSSDLAQYADRQLIMLNDLSNKKKLFRAKIET
jgi:hypothetical protein